MTENRPPQEQPERDRQGEKDAQRLMFLKTVTDTVTILQNPQLYDEHHVSMATEFLHHFGIDIRTYPGQEGYALYQNGILLLDATV